MTSNAVKAEARRSDNRQSLILNLVNSSRSWIGLLVKLFFLAGAAVSCYFVGLFLNLGLELMVVIDKQSLLEAIFFYSAIFSVISALVASDSASTISFGRSAGLIETILPFSLGSAASFRVPSK